MNFNELLEEERKLFAAKGGDYDGTGEQFGNFKRVAFLWDYYKLPAPTEPHLGALHNFFKQFDAAMMHLSGQSELKTEGVESRLRDMAIYLKIIMALLPMYIPTKNTGIKDLLINMDKIDADDWKEATGIVVDKVEVEEAEDGTHVFETGRFISTTKRDGTLSYSPSDLYSESYKQKLQQDEKERVDKFLNDVEGSAV